VCVATSPVKRPRNKKAVPREEHRFSKSLSVKDGLVTTITSAAITTVAAAVTIATATTAAAAVTAATTPAAVATTATATAALFARLRFVDFDIASVNVLAVESFDCSVHRSFGIHRHEGETTGASALTIGGKVHVRNGTVLGEEGLEILLSRVERQIANIHFHNQWGGSLPGAVSIDCSQLAGFRSPPNSKDSPGNTSDLDFAKL
jgi:hypothetical protein